MNIAPLQPSEPLPSIFDFGQTGIDAPPNRIVPIPEPTEGLSRPVIPTSDKFFFLLGRADHPPPLIGKVFIELRSEKR